VTSPDIAVPTDEVRRHAGRIDELADGVREAGSAAAQASMSDDAYGVICSFLPKFWINGLEDSATRGIGAGTELLTGSADGLRTVANNLDRSDANASTRLGGN
jgi:hypothetical protein